MVLRGCRQLLVVLPLLLLLLPDAHAYRGETRQSLTFLAAKRFNRCVEGTDVPRLTALQVRNLVRGNLNEAERNVLRRSLRWGYYDRSGDVDGRLLWTIETRLHGRYDSIVEDTLAEEGVSENRRYEFLGVLVHYLQSVTIPADVVPIFHPRPWRWPAGDRYSVYEVEEEVLEAGLGDLCGELFGTAGDASFKGLLDGTATATMAAIQAPIADMDATWEAFWEDDEPGRFGSYGPAGNTFGRAARFRCGEDTCRLLDGDPIYEEFAVSQHRLAVLATMRAVLVLQRFRAARDETLLEVAEPYREVPAVVHPIEDTGG
jgi:hypothetical protein